MHLTAYVDGGYAEKENLATIGVVILVADTGCEVATRSLRLEGGGYRDATVAEWEAVFAGVLAAVSLGATSLTLHSDRTDITEHADPLGRCAKTLKTLTSPLAEFRLVRGELRQAHHLACAARNPLAEVWKPLVEWRNGRAKKPRQVAPWVKLQNQQSRLAKKNRNRCYDPVTQRLIIRDLRIKHDQ